MENSNSHRILITSTILQSQSLELLTVVIVINVVIGGFIAEDLQWLAHVIVRLQVSDYGQQSDYTIPAGLQLWRSIREKYSSLSCTNHIWGNCNCYDLSQKKQRVAWVAYKRKHLWYQPGQFLVEVLCINIYCSVLWASCWPLGYSEK